MSSFDVVEIYRRCWLEESGQRLDNVDRKHLDLAANTTKNNCFLKENNERSSSCATLPGSALSVFFPTSVIQYFAAESKLSEGDSGRQLKALNFRILKAPEENEERNREERIGFSLRQFRVKNVNRSSHTHTPTLTLAHSGLPRKPPCTHTLTHTHTHMDFRTNTQQARGKRELKQEAPILVRNKLVE